jgi:hypothetical protein
MVEGNVRRGAEGAEGAAGCWTVQEVLDGARGAGARRTRLVLGSKPHPHERVA